jgi:hypothetical protein
MSDMNRKTDEETIVVATYNDIAEASAAKTILEEAGITAALVDKNEVGLNPLGGIEVKIFERDLSKARQLLES